MLEVREGGPSKVAMARHLLFCRFCRIRIHDIPRTQQTPPPYSQYIFPLHLGGPSELAALACPCAFLCLGNEVAPPSRSSDVATAKCTSSTAFRILHILSACISSSQSSTKSYGMSRFSFLGAHALRVERRSER